MTDLLDPGFGVNGWQAAFPQETGHRKRHKTGAERLRFSFSNRARDPKLVKIFIFLCKTSKMRGFFCQNKVSKLREKIKM
jgi:hypothetical protein